MSNKQTLTQGDLTCGLCCDIFYLLNFATKKQRTGRKKSLPVRKHSVFCVMVNALNVIKIVQKV